MLFRLNAPRAANASIADGIAKTKPSAKLCWQLSPRIRKEHHAAKISPQAIPLNLGLPSKKLVEIIIIARQHNTPANTSLAREGSPLQSDRKNATNNPASTQIEQITRSTEENQSIQKSSPTNTAIASSAIANPSIHK